jgi:DHA2 family multidrug resistance protein
MCLGMFMAILDIQVVATSLPTMRVALGIGADRMSWVQTAYLIAEIIAIPLTGFLTRLLTMRGLFVGAVSLFTLASIGCAASDTFASLIAFRVIQGFAGGTLIPLVFSAVFLLFAPREQGVATTIAGVLAVFAPTIGPIVGGWLTQTWSWHWLFLINVAPGIVAAIGARLLLVRERADRSSLGTLDGVALAAMALALAALEIGLKQAPDQGWGSRLVMARLAGFGIGAVVFVVRTRRARHPLVDLGVFADRNFAIGCVFSFVLGIGLYGSVYLMPFFLGLVRGHGALAIGEIMLVTGLAQLAAAPVAVLLERRVDARVLTLFGFALFALGLGLSAYQTHDTDTAAMFWPQVLRGVAIMFCLLPPTRMALGRLAPERVADGSGLFNLMRNLGGAIGLALIDTVIFTRAPAHATAILRRLQAGDADMAASIGIPRALFLANRQAPLPPEMMDAVRALVDRAALVAGINDAWWMIAAATLAALVLLPFVRRVE